MAFLVQVAFNGMALGAIYSLIALGYVIVYKASRVLNLAHGEFLLIGTFLTITLSVEAKVPFWLALPLSALVVGLVAVALERTILRKLVGESVISVIMVTVGLHLFLRGLAGLAWGHDPKAVPLNLGRSMKVAEISISPVGLLSLGVSIIMVIALILFFQRTRVGLGMRAGALDQETALLSGVSISQVLAMSWGLSALLATIAGVFVGSLGVVGHNLGDVALRVLAAIIFGGLDSIPGAILGGLLIGVVENLSAAYLRSYLGAGIEDVISYLLLIPILIIWPYGIFGTKEIDRV